MTHTPGRAGGSRYARVLGVHPCMTNTKLEGILSCLLWAAPVLARFSVYDMREVR